MIKVFLQRITKTSMDPPIVYIEKGPFLMMVLASIETFKRECLGYLFGNKPTKSRNSFVVTNAAAVQLAKKRRNKEVLQSQISEKNMDGCCKKYPNLFRFIGDFHSHPEWGRHKGSADLTKQDIKSMISDNIPIGIVLAVSSINKERILWQSAPDGGIKGSLGQYKFHINVYRIVKNNGNRPVEQRLSIQAPAAIRSLNRALIRYK